MSTLVLGLGNPDRGDDAVGLRVAARVADRLGLPLATARAPNAAVVPTGRPDGRPIAGPVTVATWSGPDLDLLERWDGHDRVVLVDASRGAGPPGTRRRVVVTPDEVEPLARPAGSHAMGLPGVIGLGHALGRLPARIELATIEAGSVAAGSGPTAAVAAATDSLVDDLVAEFGPASDATVVEEVDDRVPG
jgi:hydrogenase maturation protease